MARSDIKKLPLDQQSFEIIREQGYLYVDKTQYIARMLEQGRYFFMARPRRFGKTLMVSALRCFFQNQRHLFDGLWISQNTDWQWQEHPLISFDFNIISHDTRENFTTGLKLSLADTAQSYGIRLAEMPLKEQFRALILGLWRKFDRPVVILIDEYDKPIIDHLGRGEEALETARANREILKAFLGTLKGGDVAPRIRFLFITGVSKFSRVSLFSDLNNLIDLSMSQSFAAMFGYTQAELENDFLPRIQKLAQRSGMERQRVLERLNAHYDGYRFSKAPVRVYNPFSVLRALSDGEFGNYWFETGTPSFLIHLLQKRDYPLPRIEDIAVTEELFNTFDLERLSAEALLFQTGYLTIIDLKPPLWHLGYPNIEVKCAFLKELYYSFTPDLQGEDRARFILLAGYLQKEDFEGFFETINALFASIAYTLKTQPNEAYFHTLFYLMVSASGANAQSEVLTSRGRIDLVVEFADKIFIMAFKCDQDPEVALKQIHQKGYAEKYQGKSKRLFLLGIHFSSQKRNVQNWRIEELSR